MSDEYGHEEVLYKRDEMEKLRKENEELKELRDSNLEILNEAVDEFTKRDKALTLCVDAIESMTDDNGNGIRVCLLNEFNEVPDKVYKALKAAEPFVKEKKP